MQKKQLDHLVHQIENYLECWKHFNQSINLARAKKFSADDDIQFLEIKSVLVQELELILSAVEVASPTRQEIHELVGNAPSLRYLSDMKEGTFRELENQWHKIYIGLHSILGQLKVRQRAEESKSTLESIFGKKK